MFLSFFGKYHLHYIVPDLNSGILRDKTFGDGLMPIDDELNQFNQDLIKVPNIKKNKRSG